MNRRLIAQLPLYKGDYITFMETLDGVLLVGTKFRRLFAVRQPSKTPPSKRVLELHR